MNGWTFVLGCLAGSMWSVVFRASVPQLPRVRFPSLRAKYEEITVIQTGAYKIQTIKEIRSATGYGLADAKLASEGRPFIVCQDDAKTLKSKLDSFGVSFTSRPKRSRS